MIDEKLKGCPIPGCGGAAVASPNKENARVVECSAQDCLTWLPVGLWQALPRASEAVLEVTREIKARLESNRIHPASQADLRDWIPRLESAAPGMGTPGSVWIEQRDLLAVARVSAVPIEVNGTFLIRRHRVHGTPQPKAEEDLIKCVHCGVSLAYQGSESAGYEVEVCDCQDAVPQPEAEVGECCICSGAPDTFACTECMDLATRANPAHLRSLERDADVLSTIRHRMGGIDNEAVLIRVHPADNAIAPQRPKEEAVSVCMLVPQHIKMIGGIKLFANPTVVEGNKPGDVLVTDVPVIGAPSKGECESTGCPSGMSAKYCERCYLKCIHDTLAAEKRAETAEREREGWKKQALTNAAKSGKALAGEAKARTERDAHFNALDKTRGELIAAKASIKLHEARYFALDCSQNRVNALEAELSTIREQLVAAQRMVDEDNDRLVEAKREKDALRDQLGEAENACEEEIGNRDNWEDYVTHVAHKLGCDAEWSNLHDHRVCILGHIEALEADRGRCNALAERVRELEGFKFQNDILRGEFKKIQRANTALRFQLGKSWAECIQLKDEQTEADRIKNKESRDDDQADSSVVRPVGGRILGSEGATAIPPADPVRGDSDPAVDPTPRAEALRRAREQLEKWHFKYPSHERGGIGRFAAHLLEWAEAHEGAKS